MTSSTSANLRKRAKEEPFDDRITSDIFKKAYRSAVSKLKIDPATNYNKEIKVFIEADPKLYKAFIEKNPNVRDFNIINLKKLSILYLKSINVVNPKNPTNLQNILNLANCYAKLSQSSSEKKEQDKYKFLYVEFSKMYILNYILGKHTHKEGIQQVINTIYYYSDSKYTDKNNNSLLLCLAYINNELSDEPSEKPYNRTMIMNAYNEVFKEGFIPPFPLPPVYVVDPLNHYRNLSEVSKFWGSEEPNYKKRRGDIYKKCIDYILNHNISNITKIDNTKSPLVIDIDSV